MRNLGREQLLTELLALRPDLEREGVIHVALFGSRARGDHRPDSDIDLVIEVDEKRKFSLLDLIGVGHIVEDSIGLPTSLFMRRSLEPGFETEVQRDGVAIF